MKLLDVIQLAVDEKRCMTHLQLQTLQCDGSIELSTQSLHHSSFITSIHSDQFSFSLNIFNFEAVTGVFLLYTRSFRGQGFTTYRGQQKRATLLKYEITRHTIRYDTEFSVR